VTPFRSACARAPFRFPVVFFFERSGWSGPPFFFFRPLCLPTSSNVFTVSSGFFCKPRYQRPSAQVRWLQFQAEGQQFRLLIGEDFNPPRGSPTLPRQHMFCCWFFRCWGIYESFKSGLWRERLSSSFSSRPLFQTTPFFLADPIRPAGRALLC